MDTPLEVTRLALKTLLRRNPDLIEAMAELKKILGQLTKEVNPAARRAMNGTRDLGHFRATR